MTDLKLYHVCRLLLLHHRSSARGCACAWQRSPFAAMHPLTRVLLFVSVLSCVLALLIGGVRRSRLSICVETTRFLVSAHSFARAWCFVYRLRSFMSPFLSTPSKPSIIAASQLMPTGDNQAGTLEIIRPRHGVERRPETDVVETKGSHMDSDSEGLHSLCSSKRRREWWPRGEHRLLSAVCPGVCPHPPPA